MPERARGRVRGSVNALIAGAAAVAFVLVTAGEVAAQSESCDRLADVSSVSAAAADSVSAADIVECLATERVALEAINVRGELNLQDADPVEHPFRCTRCVFTAGITAPDVLFTRRLDLNGSQVLGPADFQGAGFDDVVTFEQATFESSASFEGAVFSTVAIFVASHFKSPVSFERAAFAGPAIFAVAHFYARGTDDDAGVSFVRATAFDDLDLGFATFDGSAKFDRLRITGLLSLDNAHFLHPSDMRFNDVAAAGLTMEFAAIRSLSSTLVKKDLLGRVEQTAEQAGNLSLANDARYELRRLQGDDHQAFLRTLDFAFYEQLAGYLVRPGRSALILLGVVAAMSLVRWRYGRRRVAAAAAKPSDGGEGTPQEGSWRTLGGRLSGAVGATLRRIRKPAEPESPYALSPQVELVEVVIERGLLACILVGLAVSNSTLRQMVDAVL